MRDKDHPVKFYGDYRLRSPVSREAYASDGSIYRVAPQEVVCPRSDNEAVAAVADALANKVPVTPRGGGTGLAGGALGSGRIVDCSRLTRIRQISIEKREVDVEPGIIYRDLNIALKNVGLYFPPDPSSGDSCQIGGMLANNSSGPRSVKYGLTSDYVEELTVVGNKARPIVLKKHQLGSDSLEGFFSEYPVYREIYELLRSHREMIMERWPKVKKNSAGYNLRQVVSEMDDGIFNLPALYVGSEGTLGLFLSAKLRLRPLSREETCSFRLFFSSLEAAGEAVAPLLDTGPSSLEIVDGSTLTLIGRDIYGIPATAEAMLLLEFDDDSEHRQAVLRNMAGSLNLMVPMEQAENEEQRLALWAARRAIVPTLYRHHAVKRPFAFIEDASLPVERLTEFIAWMRRRLEREELTFGLFGHIGDGNLHIRPLLDLHAEADFRLTERLYHETYEKMISLGGSSTAEHADGRLRAPVLRRVYGDEIYNIHVKIKSLLDPENLFNPGIIISERPFTDDIDLKKLELTCAACGKCNGYCPAFEVFRREDMSPRGWLRMMLYAGEDDDSLGDFYQYCLNCKSCTTVCPAGVDIAGEILAYKARRPHPTAGRVIGLFDRKRLFAGLLKLGAVFNPVSRTRAMQRLAGLAGTIPFGTDRHAEFPLPAFKSLRERYPERCDSKGGVALFHGCADNYFESRVGDAAVKVFDHFGWGLSFPDQTCCGLPMEVYGHRDNLIEKAKYNIDSLESFKAVVFTCASCLHRVADYHELFETGSVYHQKAMALKERLYDISQYMRRQGVRLPESNPSVHLRLAYHHPCHLRAAGLEKEPLRLMSMIDGVELVHPERAGHCCGQAGSFGYTHYREGTAAFAAKKEEYERLAPDVIVSSCPSCIAKIKKEMGRGIRVCHPIELIADLVEGKRLHG